MMNYDSQTERVAELLILHLSFIENEEIPKR